MSQVKLRADENSIRLINLTEEEDLPVLWTDLTRLKQVVLNLLANAVKYNRKGGSVTVGCERNSNGVLRIMVTDTGHGIPADKASNLFVPFERLGREAGSIEGTGIGLSIAKQIIEMLGGQIGYLSNDDEGTMFWVEVPVHKTEEPQIKTEAPAPEITM